MIKTKAGPAEFVELGRTVTINDLEYDDEEIYTIVGSSEADPSNGKISNESPTGVALLGQRVGAKVTVSSPSGELQFELMKIE